MYEAGYAYVYIYCDILQILIEYHANILKTSCKSIWRYTKTILEII